MDNADLMQDGKTESLGRMPNDHDRPGVAFLAAHGAP
jgi:hypothetical protein